MGKKILILNYGLHISGVSRALVNFANALARRGHDVTIGLESDDFTLAGELDSRVKWGLFLEKRNFKGFLRLYYWFVRNLHRLPRKLQYRLVVRDRYDVEIGFNRGAAARIVAASTNAAAKKLVWVHNDYTRCANPLAGFASLEEARAAYGKFHKIVCVSKQSERSFREKFGDYETLVTRSNILDFDGIRRKAAEDVPQKQGKVLCAVGRVSPQKNYPMLLRAVDILNRRGVDFTLWIVGGGEDMQAVSAEKERLGLENVVLWGAQENPYRFLAAADGYICSSVYEGLSTTTIEALVLGKPCVVTDCTGMRDILGHSEYGLVVPIEEKALADGMERLLTDSALAADYAAKAAERADAFAPERCIEAIEELF